MVGDLLSSNGTLALIAHDTRKEPLVAFVRRHYLVFAQYRLVATATTGTLLAERLGLQVECRLSGPLGGDAQIAAEVASGQVQAVVFLVDPLSPHPHNADVWSLLRLCNVHDVPVATNLAGAELMLQGLSHASALPDRGLLAAAHPASRPDHSRPSNGKPADSPHC